MNEIALTTTIHVDPDLTRFVKSTSREHEEVGTGEMIPAKSSCYKVAWRYDKRLMSGYMTKANYHKLTGTNQ
ncbi:hypothetical protein [Pontibacter mucosus]|nr:hypothetical protein [Pontibacter mucosus]